MRSFLRLCMKGRLMNSTTIYIHGFLSSPYSNKGKILRKIHEQRGIPFIAPEFFVGPRKATDIIDKTVRQVATEDFCFIGSSLGGFYATWAAEKYGKKAVLLNPAVRPWLFMEDKMGVHYVEQTGDEIIVYPEYEIELKALAVDKLQLPLNYLTILGDQDEVLNWRDGKEFYDGTNIKIVQGADHRLSNFDALAEEVMNFLHGSYRKKD